MIRRRIIDFALIGVIAIFLLTPLSSYIKRYITPNNTIEKAEQIVPLNQESLSLELKGLNTKDIKLKDTKGKVTFLHFWGLWCPDCMLEMPSVQNFYNSHKDKINFVLVEDEKLHDLMKQSEELTVKMISLG